MEVFVAASHPLLLLSAIGTDDIGCAEDLKTFSFDLPCLIAEVLVEQHHPDYRARTALSADLGGEACTGVQRGRNVERNLRIRIELLDIGCQLVPLLRREFRVAILSRLYGGQVTRSEHLLRTGSLHVTKLIRAHR